MVSPVVFNILVSAAVFVVLYFVFRLFASSSFRGEPQTAQAQAEIKGKTIHISSAATFKELISSSKLTVVDFTATWCGPCTYIAPVFGKLSTQYENVQFLKVDVDECRDIKNMAKIVAMPTFQFYKDGKMIDEFSGADASKLSTLVARYSK